eukprot:m51a1_g2251 hypothetical protein (145) ;mRNA; r:302550-302984
MAAGEGEISEEFVCAVCQDVLAAPRALPCGHVFCADCVRGLSASTAACPVCRAPFASSDTRSRRDIVARMRKTPPVACRHRGCSARVPLTELREHEDQCDAGSDAPQLQGPGGPDVPNRSTFACPYCHEENLTCKARTPTAFAR